MHLIQLLLPLHDNDQQFPNTYFHQTNRRRSNEPGDAPEAVS